MEQDFFEEPILNSPYEVPTRHWVIADDYPTNEIAKKRRGADFVAAIPDPKRRRRAEEQGQLDLSAGIATTEDGREFAHTFIINELRLEIATWRALPNPAQWKVTPTTQTLLRHWRSLMDDEQAGIRPFFCQLEAVETAIWLAEVAPQEGKRGRRFLNWLKDSNAEANPDLARVALKLATGAGKTMVMAMLIAWQAINAARSPNSKTFTRGFLLIAPGITIRDRLRVLLPTDPENYYDARNLVPQAMKVDLGKAEVVVTNYHAFQRRTKIEMSKGGEQALQGHGPAIERLETEGQMLQRVMPRLMAMKRVMVLNDEAHHCYRPRPSDETLTGDERKEAKENEEAARLWISGIEAVAKKLNLATVYDLSATPFFLSGSGWPEGTLFPWVVSDFSLMDAIECGIVKLPRVPVADNTTEREPLYRNLWPEIRDRMPKGTTKDADPQKLPIELKTALESLYGHYEKERQAWEARGIAVPPVFIVVCNNTASSKLVADLIAGYTWEDEEEEHFQPGLLEAFSNYTRDGDPLPKPRTLLMDSRAIEAGEGIDKTFKDAFASEISRFKAEKARREGAGSVEDVSDEEILREVMNTVGKAGRLGADVRCVVSVSMLTEGWDANTVTHILGLRAFGTRLLCEQVMGRALRRLSYDIGEDGLFDPEYANILGIDGLNFAAQPVVAEPKPPKPRTHVHAVSPARDHLEIVFPRVSSYRIDLPREKLVADFTGMEPYVLTPERVGATETEMSGIIGQTETLTLEHLDSSRPSALIMALAKHMMSHQLAGDRDNPLSDADGNPKVHLFQQARRIVKQWLETDGLLICKGGTKPSQLAYRQLADEVCELIVGRLADAQAGEGVLRAVLDPFRREGSTGDVNFSTTQACYRANPAKSHVNWIVEDSIWEEKLAQAAEAHPRVRAYAKNHGLGFEVPYRMGNEPKRYRPDFLLSLDAPEPTTLVVEVKGYRGEDAKLKAEAMRSRWIPAVNRMGGFGAWAFAEMTDPFTVVEDLDAAIQAALSQITPHADAAE